ncbi:MAG: 6-phosphogluconolactonase [Acidobacteria bacterium]|nr:6-phosphogluconolactonase [Acidobacteriota bacterium]
MEHAVANPNIQVFDSPEDVARAAARRFTEIAREAIEEKGSFSVALAGGSTPKRVYELLADEEISGAIEWQHVHIFFGDERCVPPDDLESNYRMANEAMLSRLPLPSTNVHRMEGRGDAAASASLYEDELRGYFGNTILPVFDLILLGMARGQRVSSPTLSSKLPRHAALASFQLNPSRILTKKSGISKMVSLLKMHEKSSERQG